MAMLLVGLLTGHFEIQQLSIVKKKKKREGKKEYCLLFVWVQNPCYHLEVTCLIELVEVHL